MITVMLTVIENVGHSPPCGQGGAKASQLGTNRRRQQSSGNDDSRSTGNILGREEDHKLRAAVLLGINRM